MPNSNLNETLADLGEDGLIDRLVGGLFRGEDVVIGPGDDCAVVATSGGEWLLLKTDCLVEDIHFSRETDPERVGKKAMNRVLSDIAAMGGIPGHALVTVGSHAERSASEVEGWYRGMNAAAAAFSCPIVGGETTRLPSEGAFLSIAMTGTVEPDACVRRSGAGVGEAIVVTGRLGGSLESGRHLDFRPRIEEARWLVAHHRPSAMMDLSDGLGSDLPRLVEASGVGYDVEIARIPVHEDSDAAGAIRDGEDYELLMTFPVAALSSLQEDWAQAFPDLPLTVIGTIAAETTRPLKRGWEHYRET